MKSFVIQTKPVGVNARYTISRGRNILSNEYRNAKEAIEWEVASQWQGEPLEEDVTLNILLYLNSEKVDIDSYLKIILDALSGTVYHDDIQVKEMCVQKMLDKKNPRIEVQAL